MNKKHPPPQKEAYIFICMIFFCGYYIVDIQCDSGDYSETV